MNTCFNDTHMHVFQTQLTLNQDQFYWHQALGFGHYTVLV